MRRPPALDSTLLRRFHNSTDRTPFLVQNISGTGFRPLAAGRWRNFWAILPALPLSLLHTCTLASGSALFELADAAGGRAVFLDRARGKSSWTDRLREMAARTRSRIVQIADDIHPRGTPQREPGGMRTASRYVP